MPRIHLLVAATIALAIAISCSSGRQKAAPPAAAPDVGRGALPDVPDLPKAAFAEVAVPAGTGLDVVLETALASNRSRIQDPVSARVADDLVVRGRIAIPAGTEVVGTVLQVDGTVGADGRATIAFLFLELRPRGASIRIRTDRIERQAATAGADLALPAGTTFHLSLDDAIRVQVPVE